MIKNCAIRKKFPLQNEMEKKNKSAIRYFCYENIPFLLTCLKHKAPRTDLFEVIKSNCSNFEKLHSKEQFNYLMNSSGPIVRAVANFVI